MATIILPELPTFLGNFSKVVNIFNFSFENHFWATFIDILLVTLALKQQKLFQNQSTRIRQYFVQKDLSCQTLEK